MSENKKLPSSDNNANDILAFLVNQGTIDLSCVEDAMRRTKEQEVLNAHPYAIFQGKDGRWRTHVADPRRPENRRMIVKTTREELNKELLRCYHHYTEDEANRTLTIDDLYPEWLKYKRLYTRSESYIHRIDTEWERRYKNTKLVKTPIVKLTKLYLDQWAHALILDNNMTKKQYFNATIIVRQVLDYAVDREIITSNPFDKVKIDGPRLFRKETKKKDETQVFTRHELAQLQEIAMRDFTNREHKKHQLVPLAVLFQFQTGLRISELCAVRYEDISPDESEIRIQRMLLDYTGEVVDYTKGTYGDRSVVLTSNARELIRMANERQKSCGVSDDGYIFSMTDGPLSYDALRYCYNKYSKEMGIPVKSSHKARKTYISSLYSEGVNLNTIRALVGHTDERTTLHNYCFDRSESTEKITLIERALSK